MAILDRCLQPLTNFLKHPQTASGQRLGADFGWSGIFDGPAWHALEHRPDLWLQLTAHPAHGRTVQHVLLDNADPQALDEVLLVACLPALTCTELAHLHRPDTTERHRLEHIAHRAQRHPRLIQMAADQLHHAAATCITRGHLLHSNQIAKKSDHEITRFATDLALICGNPRYLAKICKYLGALPQPTVVTTPPRGTFLARLQEEEGNTPRFLLGMNGNHRVQALTRLADNPCTPRQALTDILGQLHPVEIAWLQEANVPDWFREGATAHMSTSPDEGIVRILTDEELDAHPDPESILRSWLDHPHTKRFDSYEHIERAVLNSRHRTEALLRRLPADLVLTHGTPDTGAPLLIDLCDDRPEQWATLLKALDHVDDAITFGQFLDALAQPNP